MRTGLVFNVQKYSIHDGRKTLTLMREGLVSTIFILTDMLAP